MTVVSFVATSTWTCPQGVTTAVIRCWGGGGAGGSTAATLGCRGGGAAGGCFVAHAVDVTPGTVYTVTVGASIAGGTIASGRSTAASNNGNDTWFGSITTVLAKGGVGGTPSTTGAAVGATATTTGCVGAIQFAGGNGGPAASTTSGPGGGGAGTTGAGGNAVSGGVGGTGTALSGGAGGTKQTASTTNLSGFPGTGAGGGGGGSAASTTSAIAVSGGAGAVGRLEIEYAPQGRSINQTINRAATH